MSRGALSDMPEPEDAKGYDDAEAAEEEAETPAEESDEEKAGNDLKDALESGDGKEIYEAFEHCINHILSKRGDIEAEEGAGPKPGGVLLEIQKKRK